MTTDDCRTGAEKRWRPSTVTRDKPTVRLSAVCELTATEQVALALDSRCSHYPAGDALSRRDMAWLTFCRWRLGRQPEGVPNGE